MDGAVSSRGHLILALLVTIGCADDDGTAEGGSGSTSAAATTSGATASGSGSAGTSEGGSGAATSTGSGGATSTGDGTGGSSLATTAGDDTAGTAGSTTGGGSQPACDECSPEELCMQLTQSAGPKGGDPPDVMIYCFPHPEACGETVDCRCAGHLCPEPERGVAASCETSDGILHCSLAYP